MRGHKKNSRRWFKHLRREAVASMVQDDRDASSVKLVLDPFRSLRSFRWFPASERCRLTAKMEKKLASFERKQDKRLKEEAKRPLNMQRKRSHFAMLPAETLKASANEQRQKEKKLEEQRAIQARDGSEKKVFVHAIGGDVKLSQDYIRVHGLISAQIIVT